MSIFRAAYTRGVLESLMHAGHVKFASVEDAIKVADEVAATLDFEPAAGKVPAEKTAAVAAALIEKVASGIGSLITGNNASQKNTPENAASQVGGLAALDQAQRPQGTHLVGVGNTEMKVPAGAVVGKEQPHPQAPGNTAPGTNSLIEASKAASLNEMIRKLASGSTGSLITGDDASQKNTAANASSQVGGLAALDDKQRGTGDQYLEGAGKTNLDTDKGEVGKQEKNPEAPANTDTKTNSLNKSAQYVERFEATAREYLPRIPASLKDEEKVAAVKQLMGLAPEETDLFLSKLASVVEKKASAVDVGSLIDTLKNIK